MRVALAVTRMSSKRMVKASLVSAIAIALGAGAATDTQSPEKPTGPTQAAAKVKALPRPDSPQATVTDFLEAVRTGRDNIAATYLEMLPNAKEDPKELARQLAAVLQSQPNFEVDSLSPDWNGDTEDGLPDAQEDIAHIAIDEKSAAQPVRLINHPESNPSWRFAAITVHNIPTWYARTPSAWVTSHLPKWLQQRGPAGVQFWQWVAMFVMVIVSWAIGYAVSRSIHGVAMRLVKRTRTEWDDLVVKALQGPIALACSVGVAMASLPFLDLPETPGTMVFRALKGGFLAVFFWVSLRVVDLARDAIIRAQVINDQPSSRSLISLGSRFAKALLFVILVIAVLSQLGFPVASLLAGLGIGGLAVALAGQKTLENLLGTFAIGFDQPFREGDFVKVRDFTGTVETIGLRSTRFRTLDRTIVSLPNGKLADEQIETFAARDRFRLLVNLPVRYGASSEQLGQALTKLEEAIRKQPKIDAKTVSVKLTAMGEWSMAFEALAMVDTTSPDEFNLARQAVLLLMVQTLEELGVKIQPSASAVAAEAAIKKGAVPPPTPLPKQ